MISKSQSGFSIAGAGYTFSQFDKGILCPESGRSLQVRDMAPSLCSLSLIVYIIGSGQVNDLLGGNKTLPPP